MTTRRLGGDRGSVVAEFAVAFPAIALVLLFGVGALAAGAKHVRLQDAAADAARIVARGEPAEPPPGVVAAAVAGRCDGGRSAGRPRLRHGDRPLGHHRRHPVRALCALAGGL